MKRTTVMGFWRARMLAPWSTATSVGISILICATGAAQISLPKLSDFVRLVGDDKWNALNEIAAAGPDAKHLRFAVKELVCSDDDPNSFRYPAARALARMYRDSKREVEFVLSHADPDVRGAMASAIQSQGEGESMYAKRLLKLSDDHNETVRNSALETLAALRLHSPDVLTHLRRKIQRGENCPAVIRVIADLPTERVDLATLSCLAQVIDSNQRDVCRVSALRALVGLGRPNVINSLVSDMIRDGDPIQFEAITACQYWGHSLSFVELDLGALLETAGERDFMATIEVVSNGSGQMTTESVKVLRQWAEHPRPVANKEWMNAWKDLPNDYSRVLRQAAAANAMTRLGAEFRHADKLSEIITDSRWGVTEEIGLMGARLRDPRAISANTLGHLRQRGRKSLPSLIALMNRRDPHGRPTELAVACAWAVARLDPSNEKCLKTICDAFWVPPTDVFSPFYNLGASEALQVLGAERLRLLDGCATQYHGRYYHRRDVEFYRKLIENMGSDATLEFSRSLLKGTTSIETRTSGWDILEGMGDRGITEAIKESLHSRDIRVREAAVFHLRQIDSVMSRRFLEELLGDESALIRYHIVMALHDHPVSPATQRALKELATSDPTRSVREAASAYLYD